MMMSLDLSMGLHLMFNALIFVLSKDVVLSRHPNPDRPEQDGVKTLPVLRS